MSPDLTDDERARYEWQSWVAGFGEEGQRRLKGATVLVSRVGGIGGNAAYQLAAAGVGQLILAHAGNVRTSDLNRQLLMTTDWLGRARVECAARRLHELNPYVSVEPVNENVSEENAARLVERADVVVDCAPLFAERLLMNREAVRQRKPLVDAAMYDFDGQLTTILPGQTPCLACLFPQPPAYWQRRFPVFGAVAGVLGSLAAVEVLKLIGQFGDTLAGTLLTCDLRGMRFVRTQVVRNSHCAVCGETP